MNSGKMKENKIISEIWKKQSMLSFVLGVVLLYLIMSYSQVLGGKYTLLSGDSLEIYTPSILSVIHKLVNQGYFYYSWNNSMGMNTAALYAHSGQIFSIPSIVFLAAPIFNINILAAVSVLVKTGLSAMCFNVLVRKKMHCNDFAALIFSEMYALSAFQVSINLVNFIWMDAMYMLPIIIYLLFELVEQEKWSLLTVAYTYLFVTNFYMGYVVGIFSFIFLICLAFCSGSKTNKIGIMLKFAISVVLAAGISAAVLVPAAYFLFTHNAQDSTENYSYGFSLLGVLNQLFINPGHSSRNSQPYLYCGLLSAFCIPFFIESKSIEKKDKIVYISLLLILILSCVVYPLFIAWHTFDVPDGWNFRFSFLICFVLCIMGSIVFSKADLMRCKFLLVVTGSELGFYVIYNLAFGGTKTIMFWLILLANIIVSFIYIGIQFYYKKNNSKNELVCVAMLFVVCMELVFNGVMSFCGSPDAGLDVKSDDFAMFDSGMQGVSRALAKDDTFYRVNIEDDFMINSDTLYDLKGISDFASTENYNLRKLIYRLGGYTSTRVTRSYDENDFIKLLTGVKYDVYSPGYQAYYGIENNSYAIERFPFYVGLGFCVNADAKEFSFYDKDYNNTFENVNELASCMIGDEVLLYESASSDAIGMIQDSIYLVSEEKQTYLKADETQSGAKYFLITAPVEERKAYIQFDGGESLETLEGPILKDGIENLRTTKGRLTVSYMKAMNRYADCFETSVVMTDNTVQRWPMPNMYIAYYNEDEMQRLYDSLKDGAMNVTEYNDGYVKANIEIKDDSQMLFTSIPYDEGWTIYANGTEVQPVELLDGAFIGLDLGKGEYELEFKYEAPGARLGLVISLVSLGIYGILVLLFFVNIKRKKEKEQMG